MKPHRRKPRQGGERDATELLTTFTTPRDARGHGTGGQNATPEDPESPSRASPGRQVRNDGGRVNRAVAGRHGPARAGRGWAPVLAPLPVYQASTHEIGGVFPLLASSPLPAVGARIGYDAISGGAYYCHPVEHVLRKVCTNPNLAIFGEPGTGKSSTVVAFLLRMMPFGVRTLISGDVKGEYTPLLKALGITPIMLGGGSQARLNALDLGPLASRWESWTPSRQREELDGLLGRWVRLLTALAAAQGYHPSVSDEAVLSAALRHVVGVSHGYSSLTPITIPDVHRELADPRPELWQGMRYASRQQFLDHLRGMTDALGNLINGPLSGLFDAPTNFRLDWNAPAQSMDLSRLRSRGDQAIAVGLTCLGSWSALVTDLQEDGDLRIVLRDEVWRQLGLGLRAVQAVDSELRLSRAERKIQVLVAHKPSDFLSVGASGSKEVAIAKDLLALCSTRVLFAQTTRVADQLAEELALSDKEQEVTTGWCDERPGRALWKIENRTGTKVQTVLSRTERRLFDTNAQLKSRTTQPTGSGRGAS